MPGFNQKGPSGQGPMTGRKMGRCTNFGAGSKKQATDTKESAGENIPENMQVSGFGFGRGRGGRGFGMGRQHRFRGNE